MKKVCSFFALMLVACVALCATRTTTQAGLASNPSTWGGTLPVSGDHVHIQHAITWDIDCIGSNIVYSNFRIQGSAPANCMTMTATSSIKAKNFYDNKGATFTRPVHLVANNSNSMIMISGTGTVTYFERLTLSVGYMLYLDKPIEVFSLSIESNMSFNGTQTYLTMVGKTDIPPCIYWPSMGSTIDGLRYDWKEPFSVPVGGRWRLQGVPASPKEQNYTTTFSAPKISDWANDAGHVTQGYVGSSQPSSTTTSPVFYNETVTSPSWGGYYQTANGDTTKIKKGFFASYANSGTSTTTLTTRWDNLWPETSDYTFSGLNKTTSGTLATRDGWHLLFNPFSSPINLSMLQFSTGMSKIIQTWDHLASGSTQQYAGLYETYNVALPSGPQGRSKYLAPGQGFWVYVASGTNQSVTIPESAMVDIWGLSETVYYRDLSEEWAVAVSVCAPETTASEAILYSVPDALVGVDSYDVPSLNQSGAQGMTFAYIATQELPIADGIYQQQGVPSQTSIDCEVYASSGDQMSIQYATFSLYGGYQDYCWYVDIVDDTLSWIPITDGQSFALGTVGTAPTHVAWLRAVAPSDIPTTPVMLAVTTLTETPSVTVTIEAPVVDALYVWDFGDGSTTTSALGTESHTYTDWGTYTITAEQVVTCGPVPSTSIEVTLVAPIGVDETVAPLAYMRGTTLACPTGVDRVLVYNMLGQCIETHTNTAFSYDLTSRGPVVVVLFKGDTSQSLRYVIRD